MSDELPELKLREAIPLDCEDPGHDILHGALALSQKLERRPPRVPMLLEPPMAVQRLGVFIHRHAAFHILVHFDRLLLLQRLLCTSLCESLGSSICCSGGAEEVGGQPLVKNLIGAVHRKIFFGPAMSVGLG